MEEDLKGVEFRNDEKRHRFVAEINDGGDDEAFIDYFRRGGKIVFTHTEVPPALEGKGLAGKMAQVALEFARNENLRVVPLCPFVNVYIKRHKEYQDLVTTLDE